MTYSRMALIERGLGSKQANASEHEEQGTHGRIWHGTQRTGKALGMGRRSSPLMTRKPKTTVRRKEACTRVGLEPTSHAVGACAPIQSSCSCRGSRCWHVAWRLLPCHAVKVGRAVLNTAAEAWLMTKKATALQLADG